MTQVVRPARVDDLAGIAAVAVATDQAGEGAGADPRYAAHLLTRGRLLVATEQDSVIGYAGSIDIDGVDMLTDLFVLARHRGQGVGKALLERVWTGAAHRMTFSSSHESALPLYAKFGLLPRWPLDFLVGDPDPQPALRPPRSSLRVYHVSQAKAARVEHRLSETDRTADYAYWAARPAASLVVIRDGEAVVAVGATGGEGAAFGLSHLCLGSAERAVEVLQCVLGALRRPAVVAIPRPMSAAPALVDAGWRVVDTDQFAATSDDLVDPRLVIPHPGLL